MRILFLIIRGSVPSVRIQALRGVYVRNFPSVLSCFSSNVFGSCTCSFFLVFVATGFYSFLGFPSLVCTPLDIKINYYCSLAKACRVLTPVCRRGCVDLSDFRLIWALIGSGSLFAGFCFITNAASDILWRSCITSGGSGRCITFFRFKKNFPNLLLLC